MEKRNGVIHVKVNLQQMSVSKSHKLLRPPMLAYTAQSKHKNALSLAIPSISSPRLLQVKERIAKSQEKSRVASSYTDRQIKMLEIHKDLKKTQIALKDNTNGLCYKKQLDRNYSKSSASLRKSSLTVRTSSLSRKQSGTIVTLSQKQ